MNTMKFCEVNLSANCNQYIAISKIEITLKIQDLQNMSKLVCNKEIHGKYGNLSLLVTNTEEH